MIRIGIDPDIIRIGSFGISWHSFFTVVAIVVAVVLAKIWGKRAGLKEGIIYDLAPWAIVGGIVGARLVHVVDYWGFYSSHPAEIVKIWNGGIALYGAILGGTLAGVVYAWWQEYPVALLADLIAPALVLAQGIGRIGDVINGEHFSTVTDLPWGVIYTNPNSPGFGLPPTHPAVAYELLMDLAIFGVLLWLGRRWRPDGSLFLFYLGVYSVGRFFLSYLRLDSNSEGLGLNQQQWLALFSLLLATSIWAYRLAVSPTRASREKALAGGSKLPPPRAIRRREQRARAKRSRPQGKPE